VLTILRQPRYLGLCALMALLALVCSAAGTWQIFRFEQKHRANHQLRSDAHDKPTEISQALGRADNPTSTGQAQKFRTVTATGTQFSVRAEPGAYQVTLVEGSVTVESPRGRFLPGQEKKLTPGLSLRADTGGRLDVEKINVTADTSWRTGRLTFQDEPLGQAAVEMNRYSKRKLVVDPAVATTPILGVFPNGDVEAFARAAEATKIASVTFEDETRIELASPNKNSGEANVHNFQVAPSS